MAALTKSTVPVKDGTGSLISGGAGTCTDGTSQFPASGILGGDGVHFQPSMDDPTRPGYVKAAIDQTTPGTTDSVTVATGQGAGATIGATADAIVAAGAAGTLSAKLRRITQGLEDLKTLVVLGAGTNIVGKVTTDQTTHGTSDLVAADITKVGGTAITAAAAMADATSNPTASLDGACLMLFNGATWDRVRVPNTYKDQSTVAIGTIATVWTPTSGKKFRLMGGSISVSAAGSVLFEDNSGGNTIFRTPKLAVDTVYNFDIPGGKLSAAANNVLKATLSTTGNLIGTIWGTEE
jgi:hypothetical protein